MNEWERLTPGTGSLAAVLLTEPYSDGSGHFLCGGFEDSDGRLTPYPLTGGGISNAELDTLAITSDCRFVATLAPFEEVT